MSVDFFIDTNVLIYAYDSADIKRHEIARKILADVWEARIGAAISVQVLQEFYHVMSRRGGDQRYYRKCTEDMLNWLVIENTTGLLKKALQIHQEFGTSFYDANIIAAAQVSGAKEIWSEDFNTGQDYDGVVAVNPFKNS
jgi:predicted nucleic acid-binding protein